MLLVPRFLEAIKSFRLSTSSFAINRSTYISLYISVGRKGPGKTASLPFGLSWSVHSRKVTSVCMVIRLEAVEANR